MASEKSSQDMAIPHPQLKVTVGCAGEIRAVNFVCRPASVQCDASDFFVGSAKIKMTCNLQFTMLHFFKCGMQNWRSGRTPRSRLDRLQYLSQ